MTNRFGVRSATSEPTRLAVYILLTYASCNVFILLGLSSLTFLVLPENKAYLESLENDTKLNPLSCKDEKKVKYTTSCRRHKIHRNLTGRYCPYDRTGISGRYNVNQPKPSWSNFIMTLLSIQATLTAATQVKYHFGAWDGAFESVRKR